MYVLRLHQLRTTLYCDTAWKIVLTLVRWDVPDDEQLAAVFSAASRKSRCSGPPWTCSRKADLPGGSPDSPPRTLSIHLSTQLVCEGKTKELLLVEGE